MTKFYIFYFCNSLFTLSYIFLSVYIIISSKSFGSVKYLKTFTNNFTNTTNNKYKKDYFIWIMIDDIAFDEFYLINEFSKKLNISQLFKVKTKEFKLSSSIYNSIYTGKINRNYLGRKLSGDNKALGAISFNSKSDFKFFKLDIS